MWHQIWKGQGSPKEGYIGQIMRKTRAKYHYAIKVLRRNEIKIKNEKLAGYVINKDSKCLWKELKLIKKVNKFLPGTIDGISRDIKIAELFGEKFKKLYNSVSFNDTEMTHIIDLVSERITARYINKMDIDRNEFNIVEVKDVLDALNHFKPGKKDGMNNLYSDHLIHGSPKLHKLISILLSFYNGYCPPEMMYGEMVPVPKVTGSSNADDFRAITLGFLSRNITDM